MLALAIQLATLTLDIVTEAVGFAESSGTNPLVTRLSCSKIFKAITQLFLSKNVVKSCFLNYQNYLRHNY